MTYQSELDARTHVFACRFSIEGDSERDYLEHFERLEELNAMPHLETRFAVLVVFDSGYPLPNAIVRKRVAQITSAPGFNHTIGIVSTSSFVQGVLTAINWLRPQQHVHAVFKQPAAAIEWLESQRGEPLPALRRMQASLLGGDRDSLAVAPVDGEVNRFVGRR